MQERYLRPETFKYKDDDGTIKDGGTWYFYDSDKFFDAEILHKADILNAFSAAASATEATDATPSVGLPAYPGLVYIGPGIYFTAGGKEYEMTAANRAALEAATRAGEDITWRYSPARARKYGIPAQAAITIRILDTHAQLVPDLSFAIQLN